MISKSLLKRALAAAKAAAFGDGEWVGWCLACGRKHYGVDPDTHGERCEHCNAKKLYGAEEIVLMGGIG